MRADQVVPRPAAACQAKGHCGCGRPAAVEGPQWKHALKKVNRLTPREREVFTLLSEGSSNQWMADQLKVTERTVRAHLAAIMEKLGISSRMAACLAAYYFCTELAVDHPVPPGQHHASAAVTVNTVADDNGGLSPTE
ncbi:LuxR C-terminal-related transcriptional regulator [Streptomyces sp. 549]|uniref:response regulator transcription factor n=1 Tax=Streptomyces sp. 549 TaxID=3049076 RepID=UPI0024C31EB5|nr:LuxR C-terminal-related transcriptional regulator [Streptomyces sp. 549]MDK1473102.1 LuxR C-terminal-related transcriptional regulator [Streptomyces sp. 549]